MSVEADIRTFLLAVPVAAPVFMGPVRPATVPSIPHRAIFVLATGGSQPSPYMDGDPTRYRYQRLQVRIRSEPNAYENGVTLAQLVWSNLQQADLRTLGYVRITCDQSGPIYMGRNDVECHEWSVNIIAEIRSL